MKKACLVKVTLSEIFGPHPEVSELMHAMAGNVGAWCVGNYSKGAVDALLQLHPIVLTRIEGSRLTVIGGFRAYQLATAHLDTQSAFYALVCDLEEAEQIRRLASIDFLGSPLLIGLGSKPQKQVERLCQSLSSIDLVAIHSDLTSSRGIKRLLRGGAHD